MDNANKKPISTTSQAKTTNSGSQLGQSAGSISVAKNNQKRNLIIAVVVALVVLIGGFLLYKFWYQNTDKVMADAFGNALAAKAAKADGNVTIDTQDVGIQVKLTSNTKDGTSSGKADITVTPKSESARSFGTIKVTGEGIMADNGDIYFKATNLKPVVEKFVDSMLEQSAVAAKSYGYAMTPAEIATQKQKALQSINPIVSKIDNKWIKVSASEMQKDGDKRQKCVIDAIKKLQSDGSVRGEVVDAYKQNKFVVVKKELGEKDGSFGYELDLDNAKAKDFGKAIEQTTFGKDLKGCDKTMFNDDSKPTKSTKDDSTKATVEVWITRWSHQVSAIKVNANDSKEGFKMAFDMKTDIGKGDTVELPSSATNFKELQADFTRLMTGSAS